MVSLPGAWSAPMMPYRAVTNQVVGKREADDRRAVNLQNAVGVVLDDGVVIHDDVARAAAQPHEVAVAAPFLAIDVVEQIVPDRDRARLLARVLIVVSEDRDARGAVAQDVVLEGDLFDLAPGAPAVLIADGEQDGEAHLRLQPVVLEACSIEW